MNPRVAVTLPRCWGIGLSRTGTNSLCQALTMLGYRNVQHNPPFERLRTLDGGADLGVVVFYKYLDFKFPSSKFVLTLRPLEEWLQSVEYILSCFPATVADDVAVMRRMAVYETVTFERIRLTAAYHRHREDVERYFRGRSQDLLELNIAGGEGWESLCQFLGATVPPRPFPHLNGRVGVDAEAPRQSATQDRSSPSTVK